MKLRRPDLPLDPTEDASDLRIDLRDRIEQGTANEGGAKQGLAIVVTRIATIRPHDATGWGAAAGPLTVAGTADLEETGLGKEPVEPDDKFAPRDPVRRNRRAVDHREFTSHPACAAVTKQRLRNRASIRIVTKLKGLATMSRLTATDYTSLIRRRNVRQRVSPSLTERSRRALVMTDTELKVMAALAIIGLRSRPKTG